MKDTDKNYKNIFFIGIGGIGMSALARYFKSHNANVSGSDRDDSEIVEGLRKEGINVFTVHAAENIPEDADCLVYTVAVPDDNPELREARRRNLSLFTYAQMLGEVSKNSFTIAVSGTHGKTTTTGMAAETFISLGEEPSVIVGSLLSGGKTNFVAGREDFFIVEACEYKRSFLNLHPNILIITNLEEDHLDYYKDLADIQQAFIDLAAKLPRDGKIICDIHDSKIAPIVARFPDMVLDYVPFIEKVPELNVFGEHNKKNAATVLAAISVYENIFNKKFSEVEISEAIKSFKGTWRRMEFKKDLSNGAKLYDDYGHHPTEIRATLSAFKEHFINKKIAVVFQPHLFSRTKIFMHEFVDVLAEFSDLSILYPIYPAREIDDGTVSSEMISDAIYEKGKKSIYCSDGAAVKSVVDELDSDWIVVLLGAGDAYLLEKIL